jgi:hypothetical protein
MKTEEPMDARPAQLVINYRSVMTNLREETSEIITWPRYNDSVSLRLFAVVAMVGLWACAPADVVPGTPTLHVFSHKESKFIELDEDLSPTGEIPFALPEGCAMGGVYAAPRGPMLAIELSCGFGPAVVMLDTATAQIDQPITDSDSHFLAWAPAGDAMYLKVNNVNLPQTVRWRLGGAQEKLGISEFTYDLAPAPKGDAFLYSYSAGMGTGSEMRLVHGRGDPGERIAADPLNYLALARWSPDGQRIAFIKIPDSATPFTIGELWVMDADGGGALPRLRRMPDMAHRPRGRRTGGTSLCCPQCGGCSSDVSATALIATYHRWAARGLSRSPTSRFTSGFSWMPGAMRWHSPLCWMIE